MPFIVIAGSPGAGKTTLLAEFARRGHHTVSDSAREIIAGRKAKGLSPRSDPVQFARTIYSLDLAKYRAVEGMGGLVFFERSVIESRGMLLAALLEAGEPSTVDAEPFEFFEPVFILPPWQEIYCTDSERDHTFEHALHIHQQVVDCYLNHGYQINEVPRCSPSERAGHVLAIVSRQAE